MATSQSGDGQHEKEVLSVDTRDLRPIGGGSFGFSVDKDALRDLGHVDEDGELVDDVSVRQIVKSDGTVSVRLPPASE